MTQTNFDDPPAQPEFATCYDCLQWEQVYEYLLLKDGELVGLCYECAHKRRVDAHKRMGEAESKKPLE